MLKKYRRAKLPSIPLIATSINIPLLPAACGEFRKGAAVLSVVQNTWNLLLGVVWRQLDWYNGGFISSQRDKEPCMLDQRGKSSENNKLLSSNRHQSRYVAESLRLFVQVLSRNKFDRYCQIHLAGNLEKPPYTRSYVCTRTLLSFSSISLGFVCM